ncbi:hypothetical protein [Ensifer sp. YR511]|uniref:enoyl ACP reductase FabMG family protein n=1 Tax=Ensifer TaxID=106591 RepID=UPI000B7F9EA7
MPGPSGLPVFQLRRRDPDPQKLRPGQSEVTIGTSSEITAMHRDGRTLISDLLSRLVVGDFKGSWRYRSSVEPEDT